MKNILCIGEILWDMLPAGKKPGGAPFNAACHLKQLGEEVSFASRIGRDDLGKELLGIIRDHELSENLIQIDPQFPTGTVNVSFDRQNEPSYQITQPAAWDRMELTTDLLATAEKADILIFGSLAQRDPHTKSVIQQLCKLPLTKVFDINLRPPFINQEEIETSLQFTDILKLNINELHKLADWFGFSDHPPVAVPAIAARFNLQLVCLTRGDQGAAIWKDSEWAEVPGIKVKIVDTVGSGDAFLAALISSYLAGKNLGEIIDFANHMGAFVAGKQGAIPKLDPEQINNW